MGFVNIILLIPQLGTTILLSMGFVNLILPIHQLGTTNLLLFIHLLIQLTLSTSHLVLSTIGPLGYTRRYHQILLILLLVSTL